MMESVSVSVSILFYKSVSVESFSLIVYGKVNFMISTSVMMSI